MAIFYMSPTGNDTTGTGTAANPYKTITRGQTAAVDGDELRLEKTAVNIISGANFTFTNNSKIILTSASMVGTVTAGMYIGSPTSYGNGHDEPYHRVVSVIATQITLDTAYIIDSTTVTTEIRQFEVTAGFHTGATGIAFNLTKNLHVSGGWDLSTETQDGMTLYRHGAAASGASNYAFQVSGTVINPLIEKINICDSRIGFLCSSGSIDVTIKSCTSIDNFREAISTTASIIVEDGFYSSSSSGTTAITLTARTANDTSFKNVLVSANTGPGINLSAIGNTLINNDNLKIKNCGTRGLLMPSSTRIKDIEIDNCATNGLEIAAGGNNTLVENVKISNCSRGVSFGSTSVSQNFYNMEITSCVDGIFFNRQTGIEFRNIQFLNGARNFNIDDLSSDILIVDCDFSVPSDFAVYTGTGTGTVVIKNCTIDAPSAIKSIRVIASNQYNIPKYLLSNSFTLADGAYYANGIVARDNSVLTPLGESSLLIAYNVTVDNSNALLPIGYLYAYQNNSYTVEYKLRADGAWFGVLIPYLTLNGRIVATGTPITSVSSVSWDVHTISVDGVDVFIENELGLEFNVNSNTVGLRAGDVRRI